MLISGLKGLGTKNVLLILSIFGFNNYSTISLMNFVCQLFSISIEYIHHV